MAQRRLHHGHSSDLLKAILARQKNSHCRAAVMRLDQSDKMKPARERYRGMPSTGEMNVWLVNQGMEIVNGVCKVQV